MGNKVHGLPDSSLVRFFQKERKYLGDHKCEELQKKRYKVLWACILETGLGWAGGGRVGKASWSVTFKLRP